MYLYKWKKIPRTISENSFASLPICAPVHFTENVKNMNDPENAGRWVNVSWSDEQSKPFSTTLEVRTLDRHNMLLDIATVLSTSKVRVSEVNGTKLPDNKACFTLTFEVDNVKGLEAIQYRIRCISGVLDVRRGQR